MCARMCPYDLAVHNVTQHIRVVMTSMLPVLIQHYTDNNNALLVASPNAFP